MGIFSSKPSRDELEKMIEEKVKTKVEEKVVEKVESVRQEERVLHRAELQKLHEDVASQQRQEEQRQNELKKKAETVRQEERAELQKLQQKIEQQQKEINERVKREDVHEIVKDETQQLQHMALENEKTKNELMGVMKNMTEMHVQVLSAVRSIHESSGTQEKKLDDVQRRMVTATRVQAILDEKMHGQPQLQAASLSPQRVEYDHGDDPLLNSTPNAQTGLDSLYDSMGRPPDDVSVSRVYSLQVYEGPTSDDSMDSEPCKRQPNPTKLLATVGTEHDEYQAQPKKRSGLVAHSVQMQYTKTSWNTDS